MRILIRMMVVQVQQPGGLTDCRYSFLINEVSEKWKKSKVKVRSEESYA